MPFSNVQTIRIGMKNIVRLEPISFTLKKFIILLLLLRLKLPQRTGNLFFNCILHSNPLSCFSLTINSLFRSFRSSKTASLKSVLAQFSDFHYYSSVLTSRDFSLYKLLISSFRSFCKKPLPSYLHFNLTFNKISIIF